MPINAEYWHVIKKNNQPIKVWEKRKKISSLKSINHQDYTSRDHEILTNQN